MDEYKQMVQLDKTERDPHDTYHLLSSGCEWKTAHAYNDFSSTWQESLSLCVASYKKWDAYQSVDIHNNREYCQSFLNKANANKYNQREEHHRK